MSTTIVTSYYKDNDINIQNIHNFLPHIHTSIIIFTNKESLSTIANMRLNMPELTKIVMLEDGQNAPRIFLLKKAIDLNLFNSKFYLWCDVDYFDNPKNIGKYKYFPGSKKIQTLQHDKILLHLTKNFEKPQLTLTDNGLPLHLDNNINVKIFGGFKEILLNWTNLFINTLQLYKNNNIPLDDTLMTTTALLNTNTIQVLKEGDFNEFLLDKQDYKIVILQDNNSYRSDFHHTLQSLGYDAFLVTHDDENVIMRIIDQIKPDLVQIENPKLYYLVNLISQKTICLKINNTTDLPLYTTKASLIKEDDTLLCQNGVRSDLFKYTKHPKHTSKAMYIGEINDNNRQHMLQNVECLWFLGPIKDDKFDKNNKRYLGVWNNSNIYNNLSDFTNVVLLPKNNIIDPIVCKQALLCGLGLVISENVDIDIDRNLPYVDVIPEDKMNDEEYISDVINDNRIQSLIYRNDIREFGLKLDWENIVKKYMNQIR